MTLPKQVTITEVSPRDGLQNEKIIIPTDIKIQFIELLTQAGFPIIEATAFVNPKKIPALADHEIIMKHFSSSPFSASLTQYAALIPNVQGLEKAIQCGCDYIATLTTSSETFSQKNINCSIDESLNRIQEIIDIAKPKNIFVRGYISCTLGCPYEGLIAAEKTAKIAKKLLDMGCDEIALADTIGTGTPETATALIKAVTQFVPTEKLAIHFHDTYKRAIANISACLQLGISKIDSSVGNLGGCPYAKGATGNVATEEVLRLLNELKIETGIDLEKVIQAKEFIHRYL